MKEINSFNSNKKESNHITSKNYCDNIKSSYILKRIFNNISYRKLLLLIKYNNKTKRLFNISLNDYIYYSQIEIEIIPSENKYSKFINIRHTDDNRKYFHIYYNNSNEETNRYYIIKDKNYKVKKVKIIIDYQVQSFKELFKDCICVQTIIFKNFNRNNIIDMSSMFNGCKSLKHIDLSNFNTNNVRDMSYMFFECISLKEINLSNFDTNNVIKMNSLFSGCGQLQKINISNFNGKNVQDIRFMFNKCYSLKELDFSNFNIIKEGDIKYIFYGCSKELTNKVREQLKKMKK